MLLEEYVVKQRENILMRAIDYPDQVIDTDGKEIYCVQQLCWLIPVAATKEKLEDYAKKFHTHVEFTNGEKIAKIDFNNISSPTLIPEVWALCSFDGYMTPFIDLMGIKLSSNTELKDKGYDVDHWFSRSQIEEDKSESIYLRLILNDASPNRSHGGSHERKAADHKEEVLQHTKDLEFMTPPQFLKALGKRFSKTVLTNKRYDKEKEEIIEFLIRKLEAPREVVEKLFVEHFYDFTYKNTWNTTF
ncbi:UNVERIFIED_ORG: hypothetical protein J2X74_006108 [Bacillus sp. 1751]|nr:hypothetical protein [Bacillus sp. 1751]